MFLFECVSVYLSVLVCGGYCYFKYLKLCEPGQTCGPGEKGVDMGMNFLKFKCPVAPSKLTHRMIVNTSTGTI